MSLLNSVLKVFVGDKSKQDVKAIMPIVNKIKTFEDEIQALSNDELRAKTHWLLKQLLNLPVVSIENSISKLYLEADTTEDIDQKRRNISRNRWSKR